MITSIEQLIRSGILVESAVGSGPSMHHVRIGYMVQILVHGNPELLHLVRLVPDESDTDSELFCNIIAGGDNVVKQLVTAPLNALVWKTVEIDELTDLTQIIARRCMPG